MPQLSSFNKTDTPVTPPLSLYVHVPWCIKKCPYCDFNSHVSKDPIAEQLYIKALINDIDANQELINSRTIETIFIGGGTPSLLSAKAYQYLFEHIKKNYKLANNAEITLEANPGTIDYQKFKDYRLIGINRLSIGIQSFQDSHLKKLGRIHSSANAQTAIEHAKKAGFDNFNLDLMHGLPNQTQDEALDDLNIALTFKPKHLSWYQLTIEANTLFYKQQPVLPNDDILADIELAGFEILKDYNQYEISAFSQSGFQCQHNINYWNFGDYLGIGAGAHSKITNNNLISRFEKKRMPKDYLTSPTININQRIISDKELPFEFMLMASRLKQPIRKDLFKDRTGLNIEVIRPELQQALQKRLITENSQAIRITEPGFRFLNDFQSLFI